MNVKHNYRIVCGGERCSAKNVEKDKDGRPRCSRYGIRRYEGQNMIVEFSTNKEVGEILPCRRKDDGTV
jgi:hypothetical protein